MQRQRKSATSSCTSTAGSASTASTTSHPAINAASPTTPPRSLAGPPRKAPGSASAAPKPISNNPQQNAALFVIPSLSRDRHHHEYREAQSVVVHPTVGRGLDSGRYSR